MNAPHRTRANAPLSLFSKIYCASSTAREALICAELSCQTGKSPTLLWEVYREGAREPLRYGLCLAREGDTWIAQVPVTGLAPEQRYRFQFVLDGQASGFAAFHTKTMSASMAA